MKPSLPFISVTVQLPGSPVQWPTFLLVAVFFCPFCKWLSTSFCPCPYSVPKTPVCPVVHTPPRPCPGLSCTHCLPAPWAGPHRTSLHSVQLTLPKFPKGRMNLYFLRISIVPNLCLFYGILYLPFYVISGYIRTPPLTRLYTF